MAARKWKFATKKEALAKLYTLKNPETYVVAQNRENKKFAKGWTLKKCN